MQAPPPRRLTISPEACPPRRPLPPRAQTCLSAPAHLRALPCTKTHSSECWCLRGLRAAPAHACAHAHARTQTRIHNTHTCTCTHTHTRARNPTGYDGTHFPRTENVTQCLEFKKRCLQPPAYSIAVVVSWLPMAQQRPAHVQMQQEARRISTCYCTAKTGACRLPLRMCARLYGRVTPGCELCGRQRG